MSQTNDQLAYVLINPYTIHKSRTGGIISRLFTRTALELVAARMFAPSRELAEEFAATVRPFGDETDRKIQEYIRRYILENYAPDPATGRRRRVMLLLFRGEDAVRKVRQAVGRIDPRVVSGDTIRATYGDYILDANGELKYFEPAVLCAPTPEEAEVKLKIWARYSAQDGGLLRDVVPYPPGTKVEETLVLLKPDNFRFPSSRPGNIVDLISRTGLYIIAIKVHRMTVPEALEFYGPVREAMRQKNREPAGARARQALEREFGLSLDAEVERALGELIGPRVAEERFNNLINFMTGERIVALVYQGPDAVQKIRQVLGPTDPSKAPPGTIRRELGQDIMVNAAHASDSPENAQREMRIIKIEEDNFQPLVEQFYQSTL
ncbi:MAG: nucleoside-diphosphate kinase [Verrucomicrobiae bacterium]|nr:nucleoside-diphosphate kinase [Verrucomicrobiae bacterium]